MKILSTEKKINLNSKNRVVLNQKQENTFKFQELYEYLNQYKLKDDQILLSIVLPVYNEEKSIKKILESLPNDSSIEIIVIDDDSTDGSVKEIQKVSDHREIKLLKHKKNRGYGGAITTGIKHVKGEVIVTMDSDGQHSPKDIIQLIKPIFEHEVDCTIGSRYLGGNYYDLPSLTRLGEAIIEKLLHIFFGQKVMNNQNGFRAFNRKLVPVFKDAKYYGFTYATEMIILTLINGCKIKECPIKVYERAYGISKISMRKLALNLLICFLRYYFRKILMLFTRKK